MNNTVKHDDFVVSTALVEILPMEFLEHLCYAMTWMVVTQNESSCSTVDCFNLRNLVLGVRIPYRSRILQGRTDVSEVGLFLDVFRACPQVPTQKTKGAICLLAYVVNVWLPTEFALDGDSKVLSLVNSVEYRAMD